MGRVWAYSGVFIAAQGPTVSAGPVGYVAPGQRALSEVSGPPSAFSNLNLCFKKVNAQSSCDYSGGGLSVGI